MQNIYRSAFRAAVFSSATRSLQKSAPVSKSVKPYLVARVIAPSYPSICRTYSRTFATEAERQGETENTETAAEDSSLVDQAKDKASETADSIKDTASGIVDAASSAVGAGAAAATPDAPASSAQSSPIRHEGRQPPTEGKTSANLYVGNLYFEVSQAVLQNEFERFGPVKSTKIISDARGLSKGFGYVEFESVDDAVKAKEGMDMQVFEGRRMAVQFALKEARQPAKPKTPSKTLFIGNMSYQMSDKDLNDLFRQVKNVLDVRVAIDRRTGQPRGFAHADFIDIISAEKAKEYLDGQEFYGRRLRIDFGQSKVTRAAAEAAAE